MSFPELIESVATCGGIFSAVVLVHETGHFMAANWCQVPVSEFSVGFPGTPVIARLIWAKETSFTVRMVPFGGFVRFEDGVFDELSPGRKAAILIAGAGINLVSGPSLLVIGIMGHKGLGFLDAGTMVLQMMGMVATESVRILGCLDVKGIVGPVGMAGVTHEVMGKGIWPIVGLSGLMSVSVGLMNLLPIPGFD